MGVTWVIASALWGAGEASFFFIVPDVLLTAAALRFGWRRALMLCFVAAACAALTGVALWFWSARDPVAAWHAMLQVPAVGPDLLARVRREFDSAWALHLTLGAVSGVPYKLYAVAAGDRDIPLLLFVPVSFVARLLRFVLTISLAAGGSAVLRRLKRPKLAMPFWAAAWCAVYLVYFTMRWRAA
jgi:membrane protein YqaA with SNARE-associated domain